jgi:TRAP-type mannitol/chloroaromatic compound transport system substrate-binding protein
MKKATDEVMEGYAAQNEEFKEVYESQKAYMAKAREWTKMSTQYYLQTAEMVED